MYSSHICLSFLVFYAYFNKLFSIFYIIFLSSKKIIYIRTIVRLYIYIFFDRNLMFGLIALVFIENESYMKTSLEISKIYQWLFYL